jgi:DHA2 family multidrug resistance protein
METEHPHLKGLSLFLVSCALSLVAFLQILDTSITNVSIPYIAGDLSVNNNQGTWVITLYAVGNAIALPISGWLARQFGAVRMTFIATILFTLLSWVCGSSPDFQLLVVARFFQGLCGGPLIPLSQSLLLSVFPKEKKNLALALFVVVIAIGPILGPVIGGWLTQDYVWRWIFYINIPTGLISAAIIWAILHDRETEIHKSRIDWVGLLLLTIGVSTLQIMLDNGEQYDWFRSPMINLLTAISFISLSFLVAWELFTDNPLIDLRLFKSRNFTVASIVIFVSYILVFGVIVVIPLWLQTQMGYTSFWAGLALAPMGVCFFLFGKFLSDLMNRFRLEALLMVAFALFTLAFLHFSLITTAVDFSTLALSVLMLSAAAYFWFGPALALSLKGIPEEKVSSASGLFYFFRTYGIGIGTSLFVYLWDRRTIFHHARLSEISKKPFFGGLDENQGMAVWNELMGQQTAMLGLNDLFFLSALCSVGLFFLVLGAYILGKRDKQTQIKQVSAE